MPVCGSLASAGSRRALSHEQPDRTDQQGNPADYAQQRRAGSRTGTAQAPEGVMVERGHAGRGEAEHEAVEGELVIQPARLEGWSSRIGAAIAATRKILQPQHGVDRPRRTVRHSGTRPGSSPMSRQKRMDPATSATTHNANTAPKVQTIARCDNTA